MRSHTWSLTFVLCWAVAVSADEKKKTASPETFKAPESWKEFLEFRAGSGSLGTWHSKGKTEGIWEGIPAGVNYTNVEEWQLINGGRNVRATHHMTTTDGKVISTGSGYSFWDAKEKVVKQSYSGFDTGKPFSGVSTLLGLHAASNRERWKYVETSRGKTTEYVIERSVKNSNERMNSYRPVAGGKPWNVISKRSNPLASVTKRFNILGTWESKNPDGTRFIVSFTSGLDGRAIFGQNKLVHTDGRVEQLASHAMFWNTVRGGVHVRGINKMGFFWSGDMVAFTSKEGEARLVIRGRGVNSQGATGAVTVTRVVKGDTMTVTFSQVILSDRDDQPSWAGVPQTFQRLKTP